MGTTKPIAAPAVREPPSRTSTAPRPAAGWGRGAASAWRTLQRQQLDRQLTMPH